MLQGSRGSVTYSGTDDVYLRPLGRGRGADEDPLCDRAGEQDGALHARQGRYLAEDVGVLCLTVSRSRFDAKDAHIESVGYDHVTGFVVGGQATETPLTEESTSL